MSSLPLQISNHLLDNQFSMSEYFTGIGDWDSQTVARGCINGFSTTFMDKDNPPTYFAPIQQDHDFLMSTFPDLFETSTVLDDEFLNPFASQQTILSSSSPSSSSSVSFSRGEREPEKEPFTVSPVVAAASTAHHGVKYKRRKNQHKRVVVQVTAEDLSSDVWAWRKYGQKPIKGSPYPRSYYRCSSSKGCLARKQVERSLSDPEMFVITYTAEHCHGHPTRRNSLAGTTRHKFSKTKSSSTTSGGNPNTPTPPPKYSCSSLATVEDYELSRQGIILKKESTEEEEEDQRMVGASEHNGLVMCDKILNDDFLMGFDELDRLLSFGLEAYNGDLLEQCQLTFPC